MCYNIGVQISLERFYCLVNDIVSQVIVVFLEPVIMGQLSRVRCFTTAMRVESSAYKKCQTGLSLFILLN